MYESADLKTHFRTPYPIRSMETQVCTHEEIETGAKVALDNGKKLDRRLQKEQDKQNLARFGVISFEDYVEEIDLPPSSSFRPNTVPQF